MLSRPGWARSGPVGPDRPSRHSHRLGRAESTRDSNETIPCGAFRTRRDPPCQRRALDRPLPSNDPPRSIPDRGTVAFVNITGIAADDGHGQAAGLPGDLRASTAPDTAHWRVPPGWEPVADIARRVLDDIDPLVERITDAVFEEIVPYRDDLVPREDLRGSVLRNLEALIAGLAERRPPTAQERDVRRELGTRRPPAPWRPVPSAPASGSSNCWRRVTSAGRRHAAWSGRSSSMRPAASRS